MIVFEVELSELEYFFGSNIPKWNAENIHQVIAGEFFKPLKPGLPHHNCTFLIFFINELNLFDKSPIYGGHGKILFQH